MKKVERLIEILKPFMEKWVSKRDPYVWDLCIDEPIFSEAEALIGQIEADILYGEELAPAVLILTAEWYKRRYTGESDEAPEWIKNLNYRKIWENCGKRNFMKWVYTFDNGGSSWKYSAYVLGGIPCGWDGDNVRKLVKTLVKAFHSDDPLEIDSSASDLAAALMKSVEKEGSIYHFIKTILNSRSELSRVYDTDNQREVSLFRDRLHKNEKEILTEKVRTEWVVNTSSFLPDSIMKSLRVRLDSERVNGKKCWFVSFNRAEAWGFDNPQGIRRITIFVRFYLNGKIVGDDQPTLCLINSGKPEAGFIIQNNGPGPWATVRQMPVRYDSWQLIGVSDGSKDVQIGEWQSLSAYNAIYQQEPSLWSSTWRKARTAVIFTDECTVVDPKGHSVAQKTFIVGNESGGTINWADVPVYVILQCADARQVTIKNPLAEARVVIRQRPFAEELSYFESDKIEVRSDDETTDETISEFMPLLYGLDGLFIKTKTERVSDDDEPHLPENIEIYQNGKRVEIDQAREGVIEIKLYADNQSASVKAWYIPKKEGCEKPFVRNLGSQTIEWVDRNHKQLDEDDDYRSAYSRRGIGGDAVLKIYKPEYRKDVFMGDEKVYSVEGNRPLALGLLNLSRISLSVLDETGFKRWSGKEHLEDFRGLRSTVATPKAVNGLGNVFVRNFDEIYPEEDAITIGVYTLETDPKGILWGVPKYKKDNRGDENFNPFVDISAQPAIPTEEIVEKSLLFNIATYKFAELINKEGDVKAALNKIFKRKGSDFFANHIDSFYRILWENDIEPNELDFIL